MKPMVTQYHLSHDEYLSSYGAVGFICLLIFGLLKYDLSDSLLINSCFIFPPLSFNIAADLTKEAKDAGELGLAGILVWMRFMATRQLIWNKNYNVKPRYNSKMRKKIILFILLNGSCNGILLILYFTHP